MSFPRSDQNLSALSGSISSIPPPRGGNLVTFDQNLSVLSGSISSTPPPRGGNLVTFDQPLLGYSSRVTKPLGPGPPAPSSRCKRRKLEGSSIPNASPTCSLRAETTPPLRALVPPPSTIQAASTPRALAPR